MQLDSFYLFLLILFAVAGFVGVCTVAKNVLHFWPTLLVLTTVGSCLMFFGYGLVDEYLLYCVLIGGLFHTGLRALGRPAPTRESGREGRAHRLTFAMFALYMTVESFRGAFVLEDLRILRFVLLFLSLGLLGYFLAREPFSSISQKRLCKILMFGSTIYFVLYMAHGLWAEEVRGLDRFERQGAEWAGSTVAMFPFYVVVPVALYQLRERRPYLALLTLGICITAAFYYDSRFSQIAFILFLLAWLRGATLRTSMIVLSVLGLIFIGFVADPGDHESLGDSLVTSLPGLVGMPRDHDIGRKVQALAAVEALIDDPVRLIVGSGFYTHRFVMIPYIERLAATYGEMSWGAIIDIARPATFSAFLVDGGLIGFSILIATFVMTATSLFRRSSGVVRTLSLAGLFVVFLSMFVSLNYDVVLFYLAFMPDGILIRAWVPTPEPRQAGVPDPVRSDAVLAPGSGRG